MLNIEHYTLWYVNFCKYARAYVLACNLSCLFSTYKLTLQFYTYFICFTGTEYSFIAQLWSVYQVYILLTSSLLKFKFVIPLHALGSMACCAQL